MKKQTYIHLLIIVSIGLLPLLWFTSGTLILGHDAGLPFDPMTHFLDRLYVWTQRFGMGSDQSSALLGAVFIHGIEALLNLLPISLQMQQKIQFVFWFTLPGITMYIFTSKIWREKKYLPVVASIIYMLNYYLLQGWFIAERTKFSTYAALPLVMYFILVYLQKKMKLLPAILGAGLTLSILNGAGSFPLYGGLLIAIGISYLFILFLSPNLKTLLRISYLNVGVGVVYVILNAYWLFPYLSYVTSFYGRDLAMAGGPDGVLNWASYLTLHTTFFNLLFGQGVPDWYLNKFHAYSGIVLSNSFFSLFSGLLLLFLSISVVVKKSTKDNFYIFLFWIITFVAIIFSAGPSSPFGFIYEFCVRYVPGFAMFRSSYYKFNYAMWFGFSVLIAFSLDHILTWIHKTMNTKILVIVSALLFTGYLGYHYTVMTGGFFDYNREPNHQLSNRITVPQYVFDFGKWVNTQNIDTRYLILPDINDSGYISYKWGYWSLATINSLQNRSSFIQNNSLMPERERSEIKQMSQALLSGEIDSFLDYASLFAVDKIVLQNDVDWDNSSWISTNPENYRNIIERNKIFKKEREFGKWTVYSIENSKRLRVSASPSVSYLQGSLRDIVSFKDFDATVPLYITGESAQKDLYYLNQSSNKYISADCIECDGIETGYKFEFFNPKILPNSPLYFLVREKEDKVEKSANDFESKVNFYLTTADRRAIEIKWMMDTGEKSAVGPTILRYKNSLSSLENLINKGGSPSDFEKNNSIFQTVNGHLQKQQELLGSLDDDSVLTEVSGRLNKLIRTTDRLKFITRQLNQKRFIINAPIEDVYKIYVKHPSNDSKLDVQSPILTIDGASQLFVSQEGSWSNFGEVALSKGQHKIELTESTIKNLVTEKATFPFGESGIMSSNNIHTFNNASIGRCIALPIPDQSVTTDQSYLVSFSYRNNNGPLALVAFVSPDKNLSSPHILDTKLKSSSEWSSFTYLVTPAVKNTTFNICNPNQEGEKASKTRAIAEISQVKVERITYPSILLFKKRDISVLANIKTSYKKLDPVTYSISTSGSTGSASIAMREYYGQNWILCDEKEICTSPNDKSHFASAGYANGWYFEDGLSGKVTLRFQSQGLYVKGAFLSIIGYIVSAIILIIWKRRIKS